MRAYILFFTLLISSFLYSQDIKIEGRWEITPQYLTLIFESGKVEKYKLSIVSKFGIVYEK